MSNYKLINKVNTITREQVSASVTPTRDEDRKRNVSKTKNDNNLMTRPNYNNNYKLTIIVSTVTSKNDSAKAAVTWTGDIRYTNKFRQWLTVGLVLESTMWFDRLTSSIISGGACACLALSTPSLEGVPVEFSPIFPPGPVIFGSLEGRQGHFI